MSLLFPLLSLFWRIKNSKKEEIVSVYLIWYRIAPRGLENVLNYYDRQASNNIICSKSNGYQKQGRELLKNFKEISLGNNLSQDSLTISIKRHNFMIMH